MSAGVRTLFGSETSHSSHSSLITRAESSPILSLVTRTLPEFSLASASTSPFSLLSMLSTLDELMFEYSCEVEFG